MGINIGDSVFNRQGMPTVVDDKQAESGKLKVNRTPEAVKNSLRNGYINGLTTNDRSDFNEIMDDMREIKDPNVRAEELQKKLHELEQDPAKHLLARYVKAELLHVMNSYGLKPKEYVVNETLAKT